MKSYTPFIFLFFSKICSAQSGDYVVKLNGDTVKTMFGYVDVYPYDVVLKGNGKKQRFKPDMVRTVCSGNLHYYPVNYRTQKKEAVLMIREFSGNVTVYRHMESLFYFRQEQHPSGEVMDLTIQNLKKVSFYSCQAVMDSLLAKADWSTPLADLLKEYNERCETSKISR